MGLRGPKKGIKLRARHSIFKLMPLTELEVNTLQMLSEGFKPRELLRPGERLHTVHVRIQRMRRKLDAFTTWHMIALGLKYNIIHLNTGEIPNEILRSYLDAHKLASNGGSVRNIGPSANGSDPVRGVPGCGVGSEGPGDLHKPDSGDM